MVEDGYEFFAKRQLVTLFSAPNYCGEFDNAGGMMSVDETLMCSFQVWCKHKYIKTRNLIKTIIRIPFKVRNFPWASVESLFNSEVITTQTH